VKGSIGYVEYAYAKKNNIPYMSLQNKDGKFVRPDDASFAAAAAGADWFSVPGMGLSIVDQRGANAWPISTASFIIMYREPENKAASVEVLKFFDYAFRNGQTAALDLDYVPLPDVLVQQIRERVWSQINTK
jgi:phosphate transport system substrate-binding protein